MADSPRINEYLGVTAYPSNPETGRRVYRTDLAALMRWDGAAWVAVGGSGSSTVPPALKVVMYNTFR